MRRTYTRIPVSIGRTLVLPSIRLRNVIGTFYISTFFGPRNYSYITLTGDTTSPNFTFVSLCEI